MTVEEKQKFYADVDEQLKGHKQLIKDYCQAVDYICTLGKINKVKNVIICILLLVILIMI
jgi:hypothetical protein